MKITRPYTKTALAAAAAMALLVTGCSTGADAETDTQPAPGESSETTDLRSLLPDDILESGNISVGTEAFYPPYVYYDEDNETIIGIDPTISHAIASTLGIEATLEHTAWDGLLPALLAGRYDMVVGAVTVTDERLEIYDFVTYFESDQAFSSTSGNPLGVSSLEDVCGKSIAVLEASPQENILVDYNDDMCAGDPIDVQAFPSDSDALLQLSNGRAELHFAQRAVAAYNAEVFGEGTSFEVLDLGPIAPSQNGLVFRKDTPELRDAVHAALQELMDNGEYMTLLEGINQTGGAVDTAEVVTEPRG